MKFHFPFASKSTVSFGTIPTLSLWLSLETPIGLIPFYFLFDTGADVSSLPTSSAEKLGIDLDTCPKEPMSGFEGTTIFVYRSQIRIHLIKNSFAVPCVFNPNEDVPILLGRAGIIDRFTIVSDGRKKEMIFEETVI